MLSSNTSAANGAANYIEDVFSTWLYTGNGSTQTITNGIDLAGKGGLVWCKARSAANSNFLFDTARGANALFSNLTNGQQSEPQGITSFNANGFTLGTNGGTNGADNTFVSWTFRKQPKFFDVVTFTTSGTTNTNQRISHSLGSAPGMIILKATGAASGWPVYHKDLNGGGTGAISAYLLLNDTAASGSYSNVFGTAVPTSTDFGINTNFFGTNTAYVAYVLAHNAGGFGLTGTDNVISCGSYTGTGSTQQQITLGYEPQWVMIKRTDTANSWIMVDNMRGFFQAADNALCANNANAEAATVSVSGAMQPTATGFSLFNANSAVNASGGTYIYIAIRRGPMKVPTDGTKVFIPVSATPSGATTVTTNFPVDLAINAQRDAATSGNKVFWDRLRGSSTAAGQGLFSNLTNAEVSYSGNGIGLQSNTTIVDNFWNTLNGATTPVIYWNFRRAPGFFDEVCYSGNGVSGRTIQHNLTVAPELIITKVRGPATTQSWAVQPNGDGTKLLFLDLANAVSTGNAAYWNNTNPTASVFTVGSAGVVNSSGQNYAAWLFASCPGVSKVGTYTGNGSSQTINCGFTAGARLILIKRTDSTGDWYVWDSARGIVAGNDPYLLLNSTAAEVTSTDYIDTYSAGFEISSTAPAAINASGGTFIFLAIA